MVKGDSLRTVPGNTPVIIGVGQFTDRLDAPGYRGLSSVGIAVEAARTAFADALSLEQLGPHVQLIATTRTFEDSTPRLAFPFGRSDNYPRSICRRLGIDPRLAVWEAAGGNTPQKLANEMCERIAGGELECVLLAGAEAISTARHLLAERRHADWSEHVEGQVEDRFVSGDLGVSMREIRHGLVSAPAFYGLCENARRRNRGLSRADYALEMGRLFAPFTRVAAANPHAAMASRACTPEELATVSAANRPIADPYTRLLVARDQVNQGAAVLLCSVALANALGIPPQRRVFLHGYADANERALLERPDLGRSPAACAAADAALAAAGIDARAIDAFDLYSCFPIAVSNIADHLGVAADDPRGLTVTGGLPYFGGPGNNYSMHGIASIVERLREQPGSYGFVGANGGFLSKYSVGIYSTRAQAFRRCDSSGLQARLDAVPTAALSEAPGGAGTIETYTIVYDRAGKPERAVVVGRLQADGTRFIAASAPGDSELPAQLAAREPLHAGVQVTAAEDANRFFLS